MSEEIKTAIYAAATLCVWGYIGAQWLPEKAVTQTKAETSTASHDCLSPQRYGGPLLAVTYEKERKRNANGFGAPLHGELFLQGRCYHFVTGGRGRGSIPHQRYQIGAKSTLPAYGIPGYRISDAGYDPYTKSARTELFIHPGDTASAGCIAIKTAEWPQFDRDMQEVRPEAIELVAGGRA